MPVWFPQAAASKIRDLHQTSLHELFLRFCLQEKRGGFGNLWQLGGAHARANRFRAGIVLRRRSTKPKEKKPKEKKHKKPKEEKPADETQPQEQKQERLPEEKLAVEIRGG